MMTEAKADHIAGLVADCAGCDWPRLRAAIEGSWSFWTSASGDWGPENPSLGQCAVTALVVQDECGGDLIRTTVGGVSHYFNRLPGGAEVDLTRDQFDTWEPTAFEVRSREYVLSYTPTVARYRELRASVTERLGA